MPVTNYHTVDGEIIGDETSGTQTDYLTDAQGSVTATVNQSANVVNTYRYKPFGSQLAKTGAGSDPRFQFLGAHGVDSTGRSVTTHFDRDDVLCSVEGQFLTPMRSFGQSSSPYAMIRLLSAAPSCNPVPGLRIIRTTKNPDCITFGIKGSKYCDPYEPPPGSDACLIVAYGLCTEWVLPSGTFRGHIVQHVRLYRGFSDCVHNPKGTLIKEFYEAWKVSGRTISAPKKPSWPYDFWRGSLLIPKDQKGLEHVIGRAFLCKGYATLPGKWITPGPNAGDLWEYSGKGAPPGWPKDENGATKQEAKITGLCCCVPPATTYTKTGKCEFVP